METTVGQAACAFALIFVSVLYLYGLLIDRNASANRKTRDATADPEGLQKLVEKDEEKTPTKVFIVALDKDTLLGLLRFTPEAVTACKPMLRNWVELGLILGWFWLADRSGQFPDGEKSYSRDFFLFFMACLTAVFMWKDMPVSKLQGAPLNRDQTEEWKGWMQVMFLLYHYFEAKEMYNAIRLFIAGYVWMTGFGNFSYYYIRMDFTPGRFAHMMWRLNFFVLFVCLVMDNDYMLYYICPMHTIFTVFIYVVLAIKSEANSTNVGMVVKMALCFLLIIVMYEVPGVFKPLFRPFEWLVGYHDPRHPEVDPLHEWQFRSGLDRYIWIWGMICAYMHPTFERALNWLDSINQSNAVVIRAAIVAVCGVIGTYYYNHIYVLPKLEYNVVHPYTSWIPLTLFIVVRNVTPSLRNVHVAGYAWLGKITLETYISQFHVWLSTSGTPNAQPGKLLVLIEGYPYLNFLVCTALYVLVSLRLFNITNNLKNYLLPLDDQQSLLVNSSLLAGFGLTCWVLAELYMLV